MNNFTYSYPMKVYFGEDATKNAIPRERDRQKLYQILCQCI